jgi:NAD(P)H-dependent FMN reductase
MKLAIVIGSTREGRQSDKVAKWVNEVASSMNIDSELIDLRDYEMPFFNEAISPRYNPERKPAPEVNKWLNKIRDFDAYVFVTPEYNHSTSAVLKNALDYLTDELYHKPSAVVSHGSVGGARAATDLKEILSECQTVVIPKSAQLFNVGMTNAVDNDGNLSKELADNPYGPNAQLNSLLQELLWYSEALESAR